MPLLCWMPPSAPSPPARILHTLQGRANSDGTSSVGSHLALHPVQKPLLFPLKAAGPSHLAQNSGPDSSTDEDLTRDRDHAVLIPKSLCPEKTICYFEEPNKCLLS